MEDKNSRDQQQKSVLVGVDGSIASLVSLFLLKKQGLELHALTVEFWDKTSFSPLVSPKSFEVKTEQIKDVCERMGATHYAVQASGRYYAEVLSKIVNSRIIGHFFDDVFFTTQLLLNILNEKRKLLGLDYFATGHLARINKNLQTGQISIHTSRDVKNDQSPVLACTPQEVLEYFLIPLSEVRKDEVFSIADRFQLRDRIDFEGKKERLFFAPKIVDYLDKKIPASLRFLGPVIDTKTDVMYGDHEGFFRYVIGQQNLPEAGLNKTIEPKQCVIDFNVRRQTLCIGYHDMLASDCFFIRLITNYFLDRSQPLEVQVFNPTIKKKCRGVISFKSLDSAILILEQKVEDVRMGSVLVFYQETSKGEKVQGAGEVIDIFENRFYDRLEGTMSDEEKKQRQKLLETTFYF